MSKEQSDKGFNYINLWEQEKIRLKVLFALLQVRCAAVFALGTFVGNSAERTDHSTTIDHNVAMMLAQLINDGSPVVRKVTATHAHTQISLHAHICQKIRTTMRQIPSRVLLVHHVHVYFCLPL